MFCFNNGYLQVVREIITLSQPLGAGGNKDWTGLGVNFFLTVPSTKFFCIIFQNAVHNSFKHTSLIQRQKSVNGIWRNNPLYYEYYMKPINAFYLTKDTLLVHYKLKSVKSVLRK
jgi:hypothetical protein